MQQHTHSHDDAVEITTGAPIGPMIRHISDVLQIEEVLTGFLLTILPQDVTS